MYGVLMSKEEFMKKDREIENKYKNGVSEDKIIDEYSEFLKELMENSFRIPYKERTYDNFLTRNPEIGLKVVINHLKKVNYFNDFLLNFLTEENVIKLLNDEEFKNGKIRFNQYSSPSWRLNSYTHSKHMLTKKIPSVVRRYLYGACFNEELMDFYMKYGIINEESYNTLDGDQVEIFKMLLSTSFGKVNCTGGLFWTNLDMFIDIYGFDYVKKPLSVALDSYETYSLTNIIYDLRVSLYRKMVATPNVLKYIREIFEYIFDAIAKRHTKTIKYYLNMFTNDWMNTSFENIGYDLKGHVYGYFRKNKKVRKILMELKLK